MSQSITAIMLGGRIRPSPLRQAIDVPTLCLPLGPQGSLIDAWLDLLATVDGLEVVQLVMNAQLDVEAVTATAGKATRQRPRPRLHALAEPTAWRGPGGIVRDVAAKLSSDGIVIVFEGKQLPPVSLQPLLSAFSATGGDSLSGVVGVYGADEPAGVYAFRRPALELIPKIGYFDLKEQFLPALSEQGARVATACVGEAVTRIRDREGYLAAVRASLDPSRGVRSSIRASKRASVSGSAVLDGFCIIEAGAVIEDGAVVQDSVVLWGATVGGGAVISRSVIGPLTDVPPRGRVVREIVSRPIPQSGLRSLMPGLERVGT